MSTLRPCSLWLMTLALVVAIGCGKNDEPRQLASVEPGTPKKQATPSANSKPPSVKKETDKSRPNATAQAGSAEAYYAEWKDNLAAAGAKYKDRPVELTGAIHWIDRNALTLKAGPDKTDWVQCNLAAEAPLAKLGHGQTVKLRGKVKPPPGFELAVWPTLFDCALIELGPNPEKPTASVALAREFVEGRDKTLEKYDGTGLTVEGDIVRVGQGSVLLKGMRLGVQLACLLDREEPSLKVGQRVRVIGRFEMDRIGLRQNGLEMKMCLVVPLDQPAPPAEKLASIALPAAGGGLAKARVGDYATYALIAKFGSNPETGTDEEYTALEVPIRHIVSARNDKEVTLNSVMRVPGGWDERPRKMPFTVDPTQPQEVRALVHLGYTWATQEEVPVKFIKTGAGQEKIKIGQKTYDCDWVAARVISEDDDEVEVKVWFSKAVPLTGLARLEAKAKTRDALFSSIAMEFVDSGDQAAADAQAEAVRKELEKLKGVWRIESIDLPDGSQLPAEGLKKLKTVRVVIGEVAMTLSSPEDKRPWEQPFWLDPSQKPKIMTITVPSPHLGRPTQFNKAIYALDGDTLKICLSAPNKPRPAEFKIDKETGTRVITYKRDKP
jgi:uncharacterized protein (TIGR03067 family)